MLVRSAVLLSLLLGTVPASVARGDDAVPTTAVTGPTAGLLGVQRARKLPPLIVTCPAESARVGESYISTVGAAGGKPPYHFVLTGLPAGLKYNADTGVIAGTPTLAGVVSFGVVVTDIAQDTSRTECLIFVSASGLSL